VAAVRGSAVEATELDRWGAAERRYETSKSWVGRDGCLKAREKQLERDVAIKVLPFSLAFRQRVPSSGSMREARTSKLEHPVILESIASANRPVIYFVMKFCAASRLSSVLAARAHSPRPKFVKSWSSGARPRVRHRAASCTATIKPDNIMFDESTGWPWSRDFGIAKAASGGKLTAPGCPSAAHYMSRSRRAPRSLDGRVHIYSLVSSAIKS